MRLSTHVSLVRLGTGRGPGPLHSRRNRNCQISQLDSKWLGAQWRATECRGQWPGLRVEEPSCSKQRPAPFPTQKLRLGTAHRPGATATGPGLTGRLGPGPGLTWTPRACHAARLKTQGRPHRRQACASNLPALRPTGGCHRCLSAC